MNAIEDFEENVVDPYFASKKEYYLTPVMAELMKFSTMTKIEEMIVKLKNFMSDNPNPFFKFVQIVDEEPDASEKEENVEEKIQNLISKNVVDSHMAHKDDFKEEGGKIVEPLFGKFWRKFEGYEMELIEKLMSKNSLETVQNIIRKLTPLMRSEKLPFPKMYELISSELKNDRPELKIASPVSSPVSSPVASPVSSPVASPVSSPVSKPPPPPSKVFEASWQPNFAQKEKEYKAKLTEAKNVWVKKNGLIGDQGALQPRMVISTADDETVENALIIQVNQGYRWCAVSKSFIPVDQPCGSVVSQNIFNQTQQNIAKLQKMNQLFQQGKELGLSEEEIQKAFGDIPVPRQ
jgi:hypothetical protein